MNGKHIGWFSLVFHKFAIRIGHDSTHQNGNEQMESRAKEKEKTSQTYPDLPQGDLAHSLFLGYDEKKEKRKRKHGITATMFGSQQSTMADE